MLPQLRAALGPLQRQLAHGRRHLVPHQVLAVVRVRQRRQLPAQGHNLVLMLAPPTIMHTRLILLSSMEVKSTVITDSDKHSQRRPPEAKGQCDAHIKRRCHFAHLRGCSRAACLQRGWEEEEDSMKRTCATARGPPATGACPPACAARQASGRAAWHPRSHFQLTAEG